MTGIPRVGRVAPLDVGCVERQLAHQVPVERHNSNAVTGHSGKTGIRLWEIGHHLMLFPEQAQRGIQQCIMGLCRGFVCRPSKVEQYFLKAALRVSTYERLADSGCGDQRGPHRRSSFISGMPARQEKPAPKTKTV